MAGFLPDFSRKESFVPAIIIRWNGGGDNSGSG